LHIAGLRQTSNDVTITRATWRSMRSRSGGTGEAARRGFI
jgi:hypothetical protein